MLKKLFGKETEPSPSTRPVIISREESKDNQNPTERYALKADRVYRHFPFNADDADVQKPCPHCGGQYDGPTQSSCPHCNQARPVYMIDVTDNPYHTLPPEKPTDAPKVMSDDIIPTFGGNRIAMGDNAEAVAAHGDVVQLGLDIDVNYVAANVVIIHRGDVDYVVGKNRLNLGNFSTVREGAAGKDVIIGDRCEINLLIIPDGGTLEVGADTEIEQLYIGAGVTITETTSPGKSNRGNITIESLMILGPNCKITLGDNCSINNIYTDHRYDLKVGKDFSNGSLYPADEDDNLVELISTITNEALAR